MFHSGQESADVNVNVHVHLHVQFETIGGHGQSQY